MRKEARKTAERFGEEKFERQILDFVKSKFKNQKSKV